MSGIRSVTASAALIVIIAACGDGVTAVDVTAVATVAHTLAPSLGTVAAWEPAHEVPTDLEASLTAVLRSNGAWMLLPSAAPIDRPTSAGVTTLTSANDPTAVTYNLAVRPAGSGAVILALSSSPIDLDPCARLFPDYAPITIRGAEGCAQTLDGGVDFLHWIEDGRWFSAEWDQFDLGQVVSWLEIWRRIP